MSSLWLRKWLKKWNLGPNGRPQPQGLPRLNLEELETREVPTATWTGNAVRPPVAGSFDTSWGNPNNWAGNRIPVAGEDVVFPAGLDAAAKPPAVLVNGQFRFPNFAPRPSHLTEGNSLLDDNYEIGNLIILDDHFHINVLPVASGGPGVATLTIRGSIITDIRKPIGGLSGVSLIGPVDLTNPSNLSIILTNQTHVLDASSTGILYISALITEVPGLANGAGFRKVGTGSIALANNNTYTGGITVEAGTLIAANDNALGSTVRGTTVNAGAALAATSYDGINNPTFTSTIRESLILVGGGVNNTGALIEITDPFSIFNAEPGVNFGADWFGNITLSGNASIGVTNFLTIGDPLAPIGNNGFISGSGNLTKRGGGNLVLQVANIYNGQTLIEQGLVTLDHDDALSDNGVNGSSTTISNNAELDIFGAHTVSETFFINGNGFAETAPGPDQRFFGAINMVNESFGVGDIATITGSITLQSDSSIGASGLPLDEVATLVLTGQLSGNFALSKVDFGNVRIPVNNPNFTGRTFVRNGVLQVTTATALGPANGNGVTVTSTIGAAAASGTLQLEGSYTFAEPLTLNGNGYLSDGALKTVVPVGGGTTNIITPLGITLASATSINIDPTTTLDVTGVVSGDNTASLDKTGAGTLHLRGNNTYTGATTLREGLNIIYTSTSLGTANSAFTTVFNGATLQMVNSLNVVGETLNLSGRGHDMNGVLQAGTGTSSWSGLVNLLGIGTSRADVSVASGGTLTFSNVVAGDADFHKVGAGELRLTGTAANSYNAPTFVDAGTLALGKTAGLQAVGGQVFIGDGVGGNNSDVLRLDASNQIPESSGGFDIIVTMASSGLFNLNNSSEVISGLNITGAEITTGTGTLTLTDRLSGGDAVTTNASNELSIITGQMSLGSGPRTFSVADGTTLNNDDLVINGVISSGGPNSGLTKTGGGQMVLNGVNTYSGPTTVNVGTLRLEVNNALPDTTATTINGGTLNVNGKTDTVASLAGVGGTLALGGGAFTTGTSNASTTFSGAVAGAGSLTKVGTGTLTLAGNSPTYTGTTTVTGGTVLVNGAHANAAVVVQTGATLGGSGTVGAVTVQTGGSVSPGTTTGILSANGAVTFAAGSSFVAQTNGTTAGTQYDRLAATGAVALNNATLTFSTGYTAAVGDAFTIITSGLLTGTFNGLPNGSEFTAGSRVFRINYTANDVVITTVAFLATATLTSNVNPSAPGQAVTFTATITPIAIGDPTPTGSVTFFDDGAAFAIVSLNAAGQASANATPAIGRNNITATYTPAANYRTLNMSLTQLVSVPSLTTLQALSGPSVFGDNVGFVARVRQEPGVPAPTGTVTFINATTGATLGSAPLDPSGSAVFTTNSIPVGTNTIHAVYSGNDFYQPSVGGATQIVGRLTRTAVGTDAGTPSGVRIYDPRNGALIGLLSPFPGYTGGVKVAVGDINNDGVSDFVFAAGAGAPGGHVMAINGADFTPLASFLTFPGYNGGVNVAVGDLNGDGFGDLIIGTAEGSDHVKAFSGRNLNTTLKSFFAYGGGNKVGVTVGAGDINNDGFDDIITGTQRNGGHVKVFEGNSGILMRSYLAFGAAFAGGINVAGADINGDGFADVIVGAATVAPHVKVFSGPNDAPLASFIAYPDSPQMGVRVGAIDRNRDGIADIITGAGASAPHVKIFSGLNLSLLDSFLAVSGPDTAPAGSRPNSQVGVFVGGSST